MIETLLGIILLGAAYEDWRNRTISNLWITMMLLLAGVAGFVGEITYMSSLAGLVVVGGIFLIGAVYTDSVGGGDVKICAALGAIYGIANALGIIIVSIGIMVFVLKCQKLRMSVFAPYLFLGFLINTATIYLV